MMGLRYVLRLITSRLFWILSLLAAFSFLTVLQLRDGVLPSLKVRLWKQGSRIPAVDSHLEFTRQNKYR